MGRLPRADISLASIPGSIRKLERRLEELEKVPDIRPDTDRYGLAQRTAARINATIDEIFGVDTADARDFRVDQRWFTGLYSSSHQECREDFLKGYERAQQCVSAALDRLKEKQLDATEDASARTLRAYEGLDLHPEIARASSQLYRNGHYANAIEDAVKALNGLVRLRSGEEGDGTALMQKVFSKTNPILCFNDMDDQSDIDEQVGFMMMFSGAVAGLRNPRAHRLMKDDPERALEFIAFVSLLAKLLDGAKRV